MASVDRISGISRGEFLRLLGVGAGGLTLAHSGLVQAAGRALDTTGNTYAINVAEERVSLGPQQVLTQGYNGVLPGPEIRLSKGDTLRVRVHNHLKSSTSVHWHGLPLPNKMDGVPGLTQPPIRSDHSFLYHFPLTVAGTYWYHSHSGLQMDKGCYGPLIIEDPNEPMSYDQDISLLFDDWIDGVHRSSAAFASELFECHLDDAVQPLSRSRVIAQPVAYPYYLVNGKAASTPTQVSVKRGQVIRLRLINPSSAASYRIAIAGHKMRVTHTDGQPAHPVDVDVLELGMGERYDVLVHANNPGVWQIAAEVVGTSAMTRAVLRYQGNRGANPPANQRPKELKGRLLSYSMLRAADSLPLPQGKPDVVLGMVLNSRYGSFFFTVNGQVIDASQPYPLPRNKHIRFVLTNSTSAIHPIHLHGHSFLVGTGSGRGPMKDTAMVPSFRNMTFDWKADNPGIWMFHCHNLYHMHAGMMMLFKVA